ncbi:putative membrane protein YfcA [Aquimarina sp. EL_43]|uniref:sulfite exporter TauE/SafE family protein n=1 Tax=unclassified Aquimarina TaxID=2627091 RepID=UPI0018CB3262|nr:MULTISPECIES: sulfite exporter TauE/SafE family protein [unclassified Aquimarina]MBG6129268.1 putative membrane protein YfcA [Aquimarina sp. EL_35]MBG6150333.1 putative membrane protein YfcA [Aquimarina sp. EL_32]MBG6166981.1 putative membrane protein YfcA [Aquimarina sp. EL_43]
MTSYLIPFTAAFILGVSKSGLKGMGIVVVTLMALAHGAKASTGILLPLLIFADVLAVLYYNRHVRWKYLFQLLPWMIGGVLIAVFVGKDLPEYIFKKGMAVIIIISVIIMFFWERYDKKNIPNKLWFIGTTGFAAGFTTMIGNLAGAFTNIFFMATRIPKNEFIGTAAWLFFIINLFKLPFHIFSWDTITIQSLTVELYLIPGVILGFIIGLKVVKQFKDHQYRKFILIMTAIGGLVILFK